MKFLRMRELPDLKDDPKFSYMVGRLVGATEMLAFYVTLHGDEKMRGMAGRAYATLEFFFDPEEHTGLPVAQEIASEADTQILSPS